MAKISNRKVTEDEVSQEFDLKKIIGIDVSENEGLKNAIASEIIETIVNRTKDNKSVHGSNFKGYSDAYKDSLMFQAFGKSKTDVDMTLTGEMLLNIQLLESDGNKIKIGLDSEQSKKAYGHITGMKGHPFLDGITPSRDFFGLNETEIKAIAKDFQPTLNELEAREQAVESAKPLVISNITKLLKRVLLDG